MLLKPSVSPPSPWFQSCAATAGVGIERGEKEGAVWRQANLKAIIDHQPPWLVWLQCARCNWRGWAIRFFNRKYIESCSISLKKWQHRLPEATASCKDWFNCRHQSSAGSDNQTNHSLYLIPWSDLHFTSVGIWVHWLPCCFMSKIFIQRNLKYSACQRLTLCDSICTWITTDSRSELSWHAHTGGGGGGRMSGRRRRAVEVDSRRCT